MNLISSKQPIAIFALLGFLDEYFCRRIAKDGEHVEYLAPSEVDKAPIFEKYLLQLVRDHRLDTTVRQVLMGDGIMFCSKELTRLIDSYYLNASQIKTAELRRIFNATEGVIPQSHAFITEAVFPTGDREARLSYLVGAYQRYGERNFLRLYNAKHKVRLIAKLLKDVNSPNVVIVYSDPKLVPAVSMVTFEPTDELIARFELRVDSSYFTD